MAFSRPVARSRTRASTSTGVEHIPAEGPAILVANHRCYFDPAAMAMVVAKSGRTVRFLGKKEVFDVPVIGSLAKAMGGIRVERGSGSDEPLQAAAEALAGGEMVAIMPQGTIPRGPAFFEPELKGRWGAARLAQMTSAPVIPVGLWGTEKVWPRRARLPNVLNVVDPPHVSAPGRRARGVEAPQRRRRHQADHAGDRRAAAARGAGAPRADAEELAATYPPGYKGDPDKETGRRPADSRLGLIADGAVDRLAQQVGVTAVAGVFLDHVDEHPPQ